MDSKLPVSAQPKRRRVQLFFSDPSLTKQSFKDEVDVNNIVARYKKTGQLPGHLSTVQPMYGDVSSVPSYQDALNTVLTAQATFMALPSAVRSRFDNDPGKLLAFISDPKNAKEGVSMGLLVDKGTPVSKTGDTPLESKDKGLPVDSTQVSK